MKHVDIALITRLKKVLEKMFKKLDTNANQFELYINEDKTKCIELRAKKKQSQKEDQSK